MEIQMSYGSMLEKAGFSCGFHLLFNCMDSDFQSWKGSNQSLLEFMENLPLISTGFG